MDLSDAMFEKSFRMRRVGMDGPTDEMTTLKLLFENPKHPDIIAQISPLFNATLMKFPTFSLPASDGKTYTEKDFSSGLTVLYIYPKDMTSGCTIESQNFRDTKPDFEKLGAQVLGLSKDSLKSHDKFCQKESLNFPLISDEEMSLMQDLGCWVEKSMYGRKYMGAERSTFVIQDGEIIREWRKVKVPGHVDEVLDFCKSL